MKKTVLTFIVLLGLFGAEITYSQTNQKALVGFWNGEITNGRKERQVELEFSLDKNGELQCHWSIPETGIIKSQLSGVLFNEATGELDLNKKFITGRLSSGTLTATLNAHGFVGNLELKKSVNSVLEPVNQRELMFKNGDVSLSGSLILPEGSGPFPAIIFVHGSGPGVKADWRYAARRLSRLGFACLIYDKRGSGDSQGNWVTSSLEDLAQDVSVAISTLQTLPEIKADEIGLWGHSQGGWVGPLTSSLSGKVAFQVMVSGGGTKPRDTEKFDYLQNLEYGDFDDQVRTDVLTLLNQYFDFLSTGKNRTELVQTIEEAKKKPWYDYINIHRVLVSESNQKNWKWVADYDPLDDISKLKEPILVIFGGEDIIQEEGMPIGRWLKGLKAAGNENYELAIFPKGNHGIRLGNHDSGPIFWQDFVEGYWESAESWLIKNVIANE